MAIKVDEAYQHSQKENAKRSEAQATEVIARSVGAERAKVIMKGLLTKSC